MSLECFESQVSINLSTSIVKLPPLPAGWVLSAFFYGYLISHIPGGLLAQRVGGKWVFGLGVLITAILTTLTPFAADTSVWLLVALRVLEGLSEVCKVYTTSRTSFDSCGRRECLRGDYRGITILQSLMVYTLSQKRVQ